MDARNIYERVAYRPSRSRSDGGRVQDLDIPAKTGPAMPQVVSGHIVSLPWKRHMIIALLFLKLTAPSGEPIYIPAQGIVGFMTQHGCERPAQTAIYTMGQTLCVRETPEEVSKKLQQGE